MEITLGHQRCTTAWVVEANIDQRNHRLQLRPSTGRGQKNCADCVYDDAVRRAVLIGLVAAACHPDAPPPDDRTPARVAVHDQRIAKLEQRGEIDAPAILGEEGCRSGRDIFDRRREPESIRQRRAIGTPS